MKKKSIIILSTVAVLVVCVIGGFALAGKQEKNAGVGNGETELAGAQNASSSFAELEAVKPEESTPVEKPVEEVNPSEAAKVEAEPEVKGETDVEKKEEVPASSKTPATTPTPVPAKETTVAKESVKGKETEAAKESEKTVEETKAVEEKTETAKQDTNEETGKNTEAIVPESTPEPSKESEEAPKPTPEPAPAPTPEPEPTPAPHTCTMVETVWDTPTCTSDGYVTMSCSVCGADGGGYTLPMLPHNAVSNVVCEGDCVSETLVEVTCSDCGLLLDRSSYTTNDHDWVTGETDPYWSEEAQNFVTEMVTFCSRCGTRQ